MKGIKRILSVALALTMVLGLITVTNVSATGGGIILEDFSTFTIGSDAITSSSGFDISAGADAYADSSVMSVSDEAVHVNGNPNKVAKDSSLFFDFPETAGGKVYISYDIKMGSFWMSSTNPGHAGDAFFAIGDKNITDMSTAKANTIASLKAAGNNETGTNTIGIGNYNGSTLYAAKDTTTWHSVEYVIDMDNSTYDFTFDGVTYEGIAFQNSLSSISRIAFVQHKSNWYNNTEFYLDNVKCINNLNSYAHTVTFMNGSEVYATKTVYETVAASLPIAPSDGDKQFLGWFTADGEEITAASISNITEDMVVYAQFRGKLYLTEDFGDGFSLGSDKDTITTTSGFSKVSAENDIGYNILSLQNGELSANGYSGAGAQNLNFDFPAVYDGKVYIALDIKINNPGLSNPPFAGRNLLAIGNQAGTAYAANITRAYSSSSTLDLTSGNGNALATLTKNADYTKIEYTLDLDNQTYTLAIDGAVVENNVDFTSSVDHIDRIAFVQGNDANPLYNNQWTIDNLMVVEDPDSYKYTVTFMNGDVEFATATAMKNNAVTLPATVPTADGKVFYGWFKADDTEVTDEVLSQIAATGESVTLYAKFRDNLNITEDFSSFTIDAENKTMTTSSGLTFSGGDGAYSLVTVTDGGLYMNGRQATANNVDGRMYIDFPSVTSGKLNISLKLKTDNLATQNWIAVMEGKFIGIGDKNIGVNAAMLYQRGIDTTNQNNEVWLATSKGSSGDNTNVIGSLYKNQDYVTLTYTLDLDNKTYDVTWNGTKVSGVAFENEVSEINRIYFNQRTGSGDAQYANYNWTIDDVAVVEGGLEEIPDVITENLDASGLPARVLSGSETVTIESGVKLMNAVIDATNGGAVLVNGGATILTGYITFNQDGEVSTEIGKTLKLKAAANLGFVQRKEITNDTQTVTMLLTVTSGEYAGAVKEVIYDLNGKYSGTAQFRAIVQNVPDGTDIDASYGE